MKFKTGNVIEIVYTYKYPEVFKHKNGIYIEKYKVLKIYVPFNSYLLEDDTSIYIPKKINGIKKVIEVYLKRIVKGSRGSGNVYYFQNEENNKKYRLTEKKLKSLIDVSSFIYAKLKPINKGRKMHFTGWVHSNPYLVEELNKRLYSINGKKTTNAQKAMEYSNMNPCDMFSISMISEIRNEKPGSSF